MTWLLVDRVEASADRDGSTTPMRSHLAGNFSGVKSFSQNQNRETAPRAAPTSSAAYPMML